MKRIKKKGARIAKAALLLSTITSSSLLATSVERDENQETFNRQKPIEQTSSSLALKKKEQLFLSELRKLSLVPASAEQEPTSDLIEQDDLILKNILKYSQSKDLVSVISVNKKMRNLAIKDPELWDLEKKFNNLKDYQEFMSKAPEWVRTKALKKLTISEKEPSSQDWQDFISMLKSSDIEILDLSNSKLAAESILELGAALKETKIHTLNLSGDIYSYIGDIHSSKRVIPSSFFEYLKGSSLHTLDLSSTNLRGENLQNLTRCLPGTKIHTLDLANAELEEEIIELAKNLKNTNIHNLRLSGNLMGSESFEALFECLPGTKIQVLDLSGSNLREQDSKIFGENLIGTTLHTLDLSYNNWGVTGIQTLAPYFSGTKLQVLKLRGSQIGDESMEILAENLIGTDIHVLDMAANKIGKKGLEALIKCLPRTKIHTLNLFDNNFSSEDIVAFVENLQNTTIRQLTFAGASKQRDGVPKKIQNHLRKTYPNIEFIFEY